MFWYSLLFWYLHSIGIHSDGILMYDGNDVALLHYSINYSFIVIHYRLAYSTFVVRYDDDSLPFWCWLHCAGSIHSDVCCSLTYLIVLLCYIHWCCWWLWYHIWHFSQMPFYIPFVNFYCSDTVPDVPCITFSLVGYWYHWCSYFTLTTEYALIRLLHCISFVITFVEIAWYAHFGE